LKGPLVKGKLPSLPQNRFSGCGNLLQFHTFLGWFSAILPLSAACILTKGYLSKDQSFPLPFNHFYTRIVFTYVNLLQVIDVLWMVQFCSTAFHGAFQTSNVILINTKKPGILPPGSSYFFAVTVDIILSAELISTPL